MLQFWFLFVFKDRAAYLSLIITPDLFNNNIEFVFAPTPKPVPKKVVPAPAKKAAQPVQKAPVKKAAPKLQPVKKEAPKKVEPPKPIEKKEVAQAASHAC